MIDNKKLKNSKNIRRAQFDNVRKLRLDQPALIFLIHIHLSFVYACVCVSAFSLALLTALLFGVSHARAKLLLASFSSRKGGRRPKRELQSLRRQISYFSPVFIYLKWYVCFLD